MITWNSARERCIEFLRVHGVTPGKQRLLLAVSGGIDSMCMLHLLADAGWEIGVAHVNYHLRGEDSDADASLVQTTASVLGVPCFVHDVRQAEVTEGQGSLQMRAREIRYAWLETLRREHGCDFVCTAHHVGDSVETFLLNFMRGTGIRGLTGVPVLRDGFLRPMLCFDRADIAGLVAGRNIAFREDCSNSGSAYARNRLRQNVVPFFEEEREGFMEIAKRTFERLTIENRLLDAYLSEYAAKCIKVEQGFVRIQKEVLAQCPAPEYMLFRILEPYGFAFAQCREMYHDTSTGNTYPAGSYTVTMHQDDFLLALRADPTEEKYDVIMGNVVRTKDGSFQMDIIAQTKFDDNPLTAFADAGEMQAPLQLRVWQPGDHFHPLGMKGTQKLQDFFVNNKIPRPLKERIWLLTSNAEIVWICGMRLDDRYKVTEKTEQIMRLQWMPALPDPLGI